MGFLDALSPKGPAVPPPPPPPPRPPTASDADSSVAQARRAAAAAEGMGMGGTELTGPGGANAPSTAKKSLLGE